MNAYIEYKIDSGIGLRTFLEQSGISVESVTAIDSAENVIKLPDLTTFNWKSKDGIVRVNCKENSMKVIEAKTGLRHIDNGAGDPTRPYSFIIDEFSDFLDVIYALKQIEGNVVGVKGSDE
ncbi:MAG: hypothetical protein K6G27_04570 [Lachnospiraceae bacterium]|nr:hypothetical protein [Lachnospiraceae bacterium]